MKYFLLGILLLLVGCGGGGGSTVTQETSKFAGSYEGTWTDISSYMHYGTMEITVSESGSVSGTSVDTVTSESGNVSGSITGYVFDCTVHYPSRTDRFTGNVNLTRWAHIIGDLDLTNNAGSYKAAIDLGH